MVRKIQNILSNNHILRLFEKLTGTKIYKSIPLGFDPFIDIDYYIDDYNIETIIDIGANVGQSALFYRNKFPQANIYSIEPVNETYIQLLNNTKQANVKCFNTAVGVKNGNVQMQISNIAKFSVSNSIVENKDYENANIRYEDVDIITIDKFLLDNGISHVNYMKIDTEGHDLEAVKGANYILENRKVDFIETELSMNPTNKFHVDYTSMVEYMKKYNYLVFGIYEQIHDFVIKKPVLRRCNVVFISPEIYNK